MDETHVDKVVGLQIGGTVGPNDRIGMHIQVPSQPGVGVFVNINNPQIDKVLGDIASSVSDKDARSVEIKKIVAEVLSEKDQSAKLEKMPQLISICSEVATVATFALQLKQLLGL